ncbi:hypothetical protein C8J57DRAFT_1227201 [Mycena rebaudengoi]|nr:hypothetical protein C8J57DRAFT_1227201 [Mycena rebaudengoi]
MARIQYDNANLQLEQTWSGEAESRGENEQETNNEECPKLRELVDASRNCRQGNIAAKKRTITRDEREAISASIADRYTHILRTFAIVDRLLDNSATSEGGPNFYTQEMPVLIRPEQFADAANQHQVCQWKKLAQSCSSYEAAMGQYERAVDGEH